VVRDIAPTPERDAAIEIEIGGVRVLVRAGFDRDALAKVLDVVRGGGRS
jgi:hypothetical protein